MPTETVKNYSTADEAILREKYTACGTDVTEVAHKARAEVVKELAIQLRGGDSTNDQRSIRSKLVSMKDAEGNQLYIARSATSAVTKGDPAKKDELAERLVLALPFQASADSIGKMNKTTIVDFLAHFNAEIVDEMDEPEADEIGGETASE